MIDMNVNAAIPQRIVTPVIHQDAAISADKLTINIPVYDVSSRSLKHVLMLNPIANAFRGASHVGGAIAMGARGTVVVRAIEDLSFDIKSGDRVGLIGHNGAGKTTLLRTLAGIYEPTRGCLRAVGRIMPLFNLMEGMMPDATGREFIKIRGILLGLRPNEIDALTAEVVDFCELGDYINMPVRMYSTGMLVRLAFAIATSATSDILLFDELIGAGDARFVEKAHGRLQQFVDRSSIVVVASHNPSVLEQWCNRAFLLEHGKLIHDGGVREVLEVYNQRRAAEGG
jgi:ABC-2 type transport system ATP-binding protein/lipopolysaccharide transport system ATP-binding protein